MSIIGRRFLIAKKAIAVLIPTSVTMMYDWEDCTKMWFVIKCSGTPKIKYLNSFLENSAFAEAWKILQNV